MNCGGELRGLLTVDRSQSQTSGIWRVVAYKEAMQVLLEHCPFEPDMCKI